MKTFAPSASNAALDSGDEVPAPRQGRSLHSAEKAGCTVFSKHGGKSRIELAFSDFNRLRWAIAALQTNDRLFASVMAASAADEGRAFVIDSVGATARSGLIAKGTHVVHWDGYNSHLELLQHRPELASRGDLRFVVVGHLEDLRSAYAVPPLNLYALDADAQDFRTARGNVAEPLWPTARRALKTRVRHLKNAVVDHERHRRLQQGGLIVFCGSVRLTRPVVENIFRGADLPQAREAALRLVGETLAGNESRLAPLIAASFETLRAVRPTEPADVAAAYAQLNMLHRMATIGALYRMTPHLFVSEYGFDSHIDPYDSIAYHGNLYLDFGSTRGVEPFYPRTVDLALSGKRFMAMRLMQTKDRLGDYLTCVDATAFLLQCRQHAVDAHASRRQVAA